VTVSQAEFTVSVAVVAGRGVLAFPVVPLSAEVEALSVYLVLANFAIRILMNPRHTPEASRRCLPMET
jgi:hypothetical protein